MLVELGANIDGRRLDGVEEELWETRKKRDDARGASATGGRQRTQAARRTGHSWLLNIDEMRLEHALGRLESF